MHEICHMKSVKADFIERPFGAPIKPEVKDFQFRSFLS